MKLAPSILSADFSDLLADVKKIETGGADYIHVDVMDGHFVPNISFGAPVMKCLNGKTTVPYDVHLMIENPERLPYLPAELPHGIRLLRPSLPQPPLYDGCLLQ